MTSPPLRGWSKLQSRLLAEVRAFDKRDLRHCETTRITNLVGEEVIEMHPVQNTTLTEEEEQRLKLRAQQKLALLNKQAGADKTPIQVMDGVYIGAGAAAKNLKALRKAHITHIVNATTVIPCHFMHQTSEKNLYEFSYLNVPVFDDESSDLSPYFEKVIEFIEAGKRAGGVLVHCCAGQSRSAALIMAYLISSQKMSTIEAWNVVKNARPTARPNQGFLRQLAIWESLCNDGQLDVEKQKFEKASKLRRENREASRLRI